MNLPLWAIFVLTFLSTGVRQSSKVFMLKKRNLISVLLTFADAILFSIVFGSDGLVFVLVYAAAQSSGALLILTTLNKKNDYIEHYKVVPACEKSYKVFRQSLQELDVKYLVIDVKAYKLHNRQIQYNVHSKDQAKQIGKLIPKGSLVVSNTVRKALLQ